MAKKASDYRALFGLRNGHLHKALGLKPEDEITDKHMDAADQSENEHVKAMSKLHRMHKGSK